MKPRQSNPLVSSAVLLPDELGARRENKHTGRLTPSQVQRVQRLLVAAELRKKATQAERDE